MNLSNLSFTVIKLSTTKYNIQLTYKITILLLIDYFENHNIPLKSITNQRVPLRQFKKTCLTTTSVKYTLKWFSKRPLIFTIIVLYLPQNKENESKR